MRTLNRVLLAALTGIAVNALAHGDANQQHKARPLSTEQKPFGREGDPKKVTRTIEIDMSDKMRFSPANLTIRQGETVRFRVKNSGKTLHEMVLGTRQELEEHAELMKKHPGMEHEEPYMTHVSPGKRETMVWQFNQPGEFFYGCLIPGHFEAGMVGKIVVTKGKGQ